MLKRVVFWFIFMPLAAFGQQSKPHAAGDTAIKALPARLAEYYATHPTEKAYLQFDKPYYAIGDTIYYKAYITLGPEHKLSALSGVLNVELVSPDNKITRSEKLLITAGTTWGDFALTDTLKGGNYRVRAYTNWMRNEGEDSFFEQIIPVAGYPMKGTSENKIIPNKIAGAVKTLNKTDVQFLPEGGSVVTDNYSRMAFKAIGTDGLGKDIKGTITNDEGKEVIAFASAHLGMGSFNIVPQAGKSYKANVVFADGTTKTIELPRALTTGYTLSVNNTDPDTIRLRVAAGIASSLDKLSIIAQSGGTVYFAAENQQSGGKFFSAAIPKSRFPVGIVQFTLFSPAGEPLNERLVFINRENGVRLKLSAKEIYATRGKVKLDLTAINKDNRPATGSFSVAVTNESLVKADTVNENTIISDLLLTSELKGTVEQPTYYFDKITEKTQADLDNLMLTQGYRHFDWKHVLDEKEQAVKYPAEKDFSISGRVSKWGKPVMNAAVKLFSNKGGTFMLDTLTDKDGRFAFKNLVFGDSTKFVVQAKVAKGQDAVTLDLDTVLSPALAVKNNVVPLKIDSTRIYRYLDNQRNFFIEQQNHGINKHTIVLRQINVRASKKPVILHSDNLNGPGNADQVLTAKDFEMAPCVKIADCLAGKISEVIFRNGIPLNVRQQMSPMAIVVDGNFVEYSEFKYMNIDDIEGIEVVLSLNYAAVYGSRMAAGGLIITTKRGDKVKNYYRYAPGVVTYMPKGFYKAREFYSPQYDNPHTNQKMADLRSTIYWNPNIITD
ncbi:MAG TPA: hypothetical protein VIM55_12970, partial [Mucilaginibacter sp.]